MDSLAKFRYERKPRHNYVNSVNCCKIQLQRQTNKFDFRAVSPKEKSYRERARWGIAHFLLLIARKRAFLLPTLIIVPAISARKKIV